MTIHHESKLYNCYIQLFEVPIYGSKVCFIKYKSIKGYKKAIEYLKSIEFDIGELDDPEYYNCYGFVHKEKTKLGTVQLIILNTKKDYLKKYKDTLAHEGSHLIQSISEHHGLEYKKGGHNEHIAYLTGYLLNYLHTL